ncbi:LysE family translocator [Dongia rigui]|uniref:LysE family transporter n=1 Tax=Dongia rigui TaxID=940149 RepID=A0ABU5DVA6_9PROT|nr:LysE family transporter [Dongia rigui]MDY0871259.1 LysE family transporter [Dongia rigui]
MTDFMSILAIMAAMLIGAISPGPSFLLVARTSLSQSRPHGLAAALGMGVGGMVLATLAVVGLQALFMQVGWLYIGFKIGGGAYLVYLGFCLWRGAKEPLAAATEMAGGNRSLFRTFLLSLATQLSNPKTVIFYSSVFAALLPAQPSLTLILALPFVLFLIEGGWYSAVALAFSTAKPRAAYLSFKAWIDRAAGAVMASLGLRLIFGGVKV